MIDIFPIIGLHCFTLPEQYRKQMLFMIKQPNKAIDAKGFESKQGFVICKGSTIRKDITASCSASIVQLREQYIKQGIIHLMNNNYEIMEDITFTSPSTAASVVMGVSANGRIEWKNSDGISLKTLQLKSLEEKESCE